MSNVAGILNGGKVALYAEVTASNFVLIGGQTTHSLSMAMAAIDASSKNDPNTRCYLEGEGSLTADVTSEILFSNDAAYQFMLSAHQTKTFINVIERRGNEVLNPAAAITVLVTSIGDNPALNAAYSTSISLSSSEEFSATAEPATITGAVTGFSIDTSAETATPFGIVKVNADYWVSDADTGFIYVYNSAGVYSGTSYDVSAQTTEPAGMTFDGMHVWVCGLGDDNIYKFDTAGAYASFSFSTASSGTETRSVTRDNNGFFWVVMGSSARAYRYTSTGVDTGTIFNLSGQDPTPFGMAFDGVFFWVVGANNSTIYQYDKLGVYTGFSFYIGSQDLQPLDIYSNSVNLFVAGSATGAIYTYE